MTERYAANVSLVHHADGLVTITVFGNAIEDPIESMRHLTYNVEGPEEATDFADWLRQVFAAATEGV